MKHLPLRSRVLGLSTLGIIVIVVLLLLLFGAWPTWGLHSYGYVAPGGLLVIAIVVIVVLALTNRL